MNNFNPEWNNQNDNNENPSTNDTNTDNLSTNSGNQAADNIPVGTSANTGSYSYTGDRLTENRTDFANHREWNGNNAREERSYQMPYVNGNGGISYTAYNDNGGKKEKKEKKKVTVTKGGLAVICCVALCLSCATGFLGAYAANAISGKNAGNPIYTVDGSASQSPSEDHTAVIYRSVNTTNLGSATENGLTYKDVADLVQNSVVEIVTEFNMTSHWFQYVASGAGSGVIISEDGYVITNNHVISDEDSGELADNITVRLRNGEEYRAKIIGTDSESDTAVLKIEATGLTPAVCGDSDKLAVGEEVMAVGNPLGELGGTVTNGIVSATNREIVVGDVTMNLIQTNAAVNPGNSGGGLFNMNGELIGIVNAKSSGTDVEGLGFAIPVNDALTVVEQLLEYGYVRGKVMIGVLFLDATEPAVANYYGLKAGLYISSLTEGYNDDVLQPGDRLIAINGNEVSEYEDVTTIVNASEIGDVLIFQLYRKGKLVEAEVTVYEKVPVEKDANVEFEEEDQKVNGFPETDVEYYSSPMPEEGFEEKWNNPFEGTPFEDWFSNWGGY